MTVGRAGDDSGTIIEGLLRQRLIDIENAADGDVLAYIGPIIDDFHDILRAAIDNLDERRERLVVVLETNGGYAESAERFQRLFRHNYKIVEFVIPGFAMSAGTVLAMCGDAIWMDYSSVLGPIDPQVPRGERGQVSALGYIEKYEALMAKADEPGGLNTAELMYLVQAFDPGDVSQYEHARDLAITLLKDWLVKFKFKNWKITEGHKTRVTKKMKEERAEEIGTALTNTKRWHSHGRGIPMDVLVEELNLQIDDFGSHRKLADPIGQYYALLKDYMLRRGHSVVWHTRRGHYGL